MRNMRPQRSVASRLRESHCHPSFRRVSFVRVYGIHEIPFGKALYYSHAINERYTRFPAPSLRSFAGARFHWSLRCDASFPLNVRAEISRDIRGTTCYIKNNWHAHRSRAMRYVFERSGACFPLLPSFPLIVYSSCVYGYAFRAK